MVSSAVKLAPLSGVVSVVMLVLALVFEGSPPAGDARTEEVVAFYADNEGRLYVGTIFGGLAAALQVWFGGSVYLAFRRGGDDAGRLGLIAFGGLVAASIGTAILFGFVLAAAETVNNVPSEVTQTIGTLAALFIVPLAVGMLVALIASAVAILRHGVLPRTVGYVSIVIAAAATLSAAFGAYIAVASWVVAVIVWLPLMSVVMINRKGGSQS